MLPHGLPLRVVLLCSLVALFSMVTADEVQTAKPRCSNRCGDLTFSYLFGMNNTGNDCYFEEESHNFLIFCDNLTNPHTPYIKDKSSNIKILNISIENHEISIMVFVAKNCYDSSGETSYNNDPRLTLPIFPISSAKNTFIAVGCDMYATFTGRQGSTFITGCLSSCDSISDVINGSCSGIGCCDTSIPRDAYRFNISVTSYNNHRGIWGFNPCGYAFVAEDGFFSFSIGDLYKPRFDEVPIVLDWLIPEETCDDAKKNPTTYMCRENSNCTDAENGYGYQCHCLEGFQGNPDLQNGCQDINECMISQPCIGICTNLPGRYNCSCPEGSQGDGRKDGKGLGTGIGAIVFLLLCWWSYKYIERRREAKLKQKFFKRNGGILLQQHSFPVEDNHMEKGKLFTSMELDTATDHFNENRILGQGGQGTVYKGMLIDGTIIAVKKSKVIDIGQVEQFVNEIIVLSKINHRNVVKLLGFCLESEVPLLVYEFIPNGTLYQYPHDPDREFPISWEMRLRIANEVAGALSYLHSAAAIPVYHRDVKSSNILLDENYRAKVSDFGASRSITIDQTHLTTMVRGTIGYLDPEYYQTSQFTNKSDVYSFGIVLVELLTREKPISQLRAEEDRNLASYFIISMEENRLFDILDKEVLDHGENEEIIAVSNLVKRCLALHGRYRPTMKEVTMELERLRSLRNPTIVQQNEEEIDCIRTGSICVTTTIPMLMQLEAGVELTSMEKDQLLLLPR
ncbi:hypothetical protein BT93_B2262 [Corymbia citriodora subsp. variegata]|nr:hypothetical protein BT93_B2262 [Corymbia citriodora subsp. variegata]